MLVVRNALEYNVFGNNVFGLIVYKPKPKSKAKILYSG
jgi:hypothetical protein